VGGSLAEHFNHQNFTVLQGLTSPSSGTKIKHTFQTTVLTAPMNFPAIPRSNIPLSARAFTWLLGGLTGLTALSIDMSLPAMPQLQKIFGVDVAAAQLTLSLFLLGYAVGQILCGPLSDRFGRRPVLLCGVAIFTLAGLLCATSTSLTMLVVWRCLQGLGASVGPIISRAIIRDRYDSRDGAGIMSQMTQIMIVAPLVAPTLGGYLLVHQGWQAIFCVLALCGVMLWLACWRWLPETLPPGQDGARGWVQLGKGLRSVVTHRASQRHILTSCFAYGGMFAYISGSPFVLIKVFGIPEQQFGIYFGLTAMCLMAGATLNRRWLVYMVPTVILQRGVTAVLLAGVAIGLLAFLHVGGVAGMIVPMMLYLFGQGLVQPNAMAAAMEPHGEVAGVASSVMGSLQTLTSAVAGYAVGACFNGTSLSLGLTVAFLATLTFVMFDRAGMRRAVSKANEATVPVLETA